MNREMGWRGRLRQDRILQAELLGLWTVGVGVVLLLALLLTHGAK